LDPLAARLLAQLGGRFHIQTTVLSDDDRLGRCHEGTDFFDLGRLLLPIETHGSGSTQNVLRVRACARARHRLHHPAAEADILSARQRTSNAFSGAPSALDAACTSVPPSVTAGAEQSVIKEEAIQRRR